jgi:hypothetical protein
MVPFDGEIFGTRMVFIAVHGKDKGSRFVLKALESASLLMHRVSCIT